VGLGTPVAAVYRTLGISEQACSRWKRRFAGMGVAAWRRWRQLGEENRTPKPLVADLTRDQYMGEEGMQTKW
jgi:hypothetical protein